MQFIVVLIVLPLVRASTLAQDAYLLRSSFCCWQLTETSPHINDALNLSPDPHGIKDISQWKVDDHMLKSCGDGNPKTVMNNAQCGMIALAPKEIFHDTTLGTAQVTYPAGLPGFGGFACLNRICPPEAFSTGCNGYTETCQSCMEKMQFTCAMGYSFDSYSGMCLPGGACLDNLVNDDIKEQCELLSATQNVVSHTLGLETIGCNAYWANKLFVEQTNSDGEVLKKISEQVLHVECESAMDSMTFTEHCFFLKSHSDSTRCQEDCPDPLGNGVGVIFSDACTPRTDGLCPTDHISKINVVFDPLKMNTHGLTWDDTHLDESYTDHVAVKKLGEGACCHRYHVAADGQSIGGTGSPGCDSEAIDTICGAVVSHQNPFIRWGGAMCPYTKFYDARYFDGRTPTDLFDGKGPFITHTCKDCIEAVQISCAPHYSWNPTTNTCRPGGECDDDQPRCGLKRGEKTVANEHDGRIALDKTACAGHQTEAQCDAGKYYVQNFCEWLPTRVDPAHSNYGKLSNGDYNCQGPIGSNCHDKDNSCPVKSLACSVCGNGFTSGKRYITTASCRWDGAIENSIPIMCSYGGDDGLLNCGQVPLTLPPSPPPEVDTSCDLFICEMDTLDWVVTVASLAGFGGLVYLTILLFWGNPSKGELNHGFYDPKART